MILKVIYPDEKEEMMEVDVFRVFKNSCNEMYLRVLGVNKAIQVKAVFVKQVTVKYQAVFVGQSEKDFR